MKIVALNGSPKGKYSNTIQIIRYIGSCYSDNEIKIIDIGMKIKELDKNVAVFDNIMNEIESADCILWCYPVYTFLIPYQLMHFIDLIYERNRTGAFKGKYTSQVLTSMHFYDHTAYNYLLNISEDLDMRTIPGISLEMNDLFTEKGRNTIKKFGHELFTSISNGFYSTKKFKLSNYDQTPFKCNVGFVEKNVTPKKIILITDATDDDKNLFEMIKAYENALPFPVTKVNLNDLKLYGGCLGCLQCTFEGHCFYKDGFDKFHRSVILEADIIIYAASINRHYFNSSWIKYDNRQFYNGHRITFAGKAAGYLISGNLREESNLREIIEARSNVGEYYLIDVVTDEVESTDAGDVISENAINTRIKKLAEKTVYALQNSPERPSNFYGVGGMKIFRDLVYSMQGIMQEDYRFYKKTGRFDYPQNNKRQLLLFKILGFFLKFKSIRAKARTGMNKMMLKKFEKVIMQESKNNQD